MLGKRIEQLRSELGWSQVKLAKKLNIAKQTVSNWENDNIQPSIEMLMRIAKLFGVSTDDLLGLDDIPRLSVENLPTHVIAHITLLIDDYRALEACAGEK